MLCVTHVGSLAHFLVCHNYYFLRCYYFLLCYHNYFYTANILKCPTTIFFYSSIISQCATAIIFYTVGKGKQKYVRFKLYTFYYYPHPLLNSGKSQSLSTLFFCLGGGMQYLQDNSELVAANDKQGCTLQDCNGRGPEARQAAYVQSLA